MVTVKYKHHSSLVEIWKDKLEEIVIAHQFIQDTSIDNSILVNSKETIIGDEAISKHIDELMEFQKAWFACACK